MVLTGTNISFHDILEMVEVCSYTNAKERANATLFDQQMTVTAFPSFASGRIEKFMVEKASENAIKGRVVMEQAIARLQAEAREKLAEMEEVYSAAQLKVNELLRREDEQKTGTNTTPSLYNVLGPSQTLPSSLRR
jgi:hypothetical protein